MMKFIRGNITTLLFVFIAVLLTLQIRSWFEPSRVDPKVIEAQVKLKQYEEQLPEIRKELDVIYAKYDSLLLASVQRYEALEQKKQPLQYAIKQIPVVVGNYDKEQLRRAISDYYKKYN